MGLKVKIVLHISWLELLWEYQHLLGEQVRLLTRWHHVRVKDDACERHVVASSGTSCYFAARVTFIRVRNREWLMLLAVQSTGGSLSYIWRCLSYCLLLLLEILTRGCFIRDEVCRGALVQGVNATWRVLLLLQNVIRRQELRICLLNASWWTVYASSSRRWPLHSYDAARPVISYCCCFNSFFFLFSFLAFLSGLATVIELFVDVFRRVNEFLIVFCTEFFRREDDLKVAAVFVFPIVTFSKLCGAHLVLRLSADFCLAFDGPALKLQRFLLFVLHFLPVADIEELDCVGHQVFLYFEVEGRICWETWRVVYLKDPGFEFVVEENVEPEDLKTHRVLNVVWLAWTIRMRKLWLDCANSLDNRRLDVMEDSCWVMSHLVDVLHRERQTPFMAQVIFLTPFVLNVVAWHLVDRVIRKVHIQVIKIVLVGWSVLACCQTAESLIVKKDSQRVNTT